MNHLCNFDPKAQAASQGFVLLPILLSFGVLLILAILGFTRQRTEATVREGLDTATESAFTQSLWENALFESALLTWTEGTLSPDNTDRLLQQAILAGLQPQALGFEASVVAGRIFWNEETPQQTPFPDWEWGHIAWNLAVRDSHPGPVQWASGGFMDVWYEGEENHLHSARDWNIEFIRIPFFLPYLHAYGLARMGRVPRYVTPRLLDWHHDFSLSGKTLNTHEDELAERGMQSRITLLFDSAGQQRLPIHLLPLAERSWLFPETLLKPSFYEALEQRGPLWVLGRPDLNQDLAGVVWDDSSGTLFIRIAQLEPDVLTVVDTEGGGNVVLQGESSLSPFTGQSPKLVCFRSFQEEATRVLLTGDYFWDLTLFTTHTVVQSNQVLSAGRVRGGYFGNIFLHPYAELRGNLALQGSLAYYWEAPPLDLHLDLPLSEGLGPYLSLAWSPVLTVPFFSRR